MTKAQIFLIVVLVATIGILLSFGQGQYLTLEYLKSQQAAIDHYRQGHLVSTTLGFFVLYIAVTGLSLPGSALLSLAGGAIFGLAWGTLIGSFASTIGATFAFLIARGLLRDIVQQRFGDKLEVANRGIQKDGAFYLFTLRLIPVFPFFIVNLLMGLTPIRTWTFYWISQLGMLSVTLVYVNAGTQLAQLEFLSDILSPGLVASFSLIGLFPLLARKGLEIFNARRVPR